MRTGGDTCGGATVAACAVAVSTEAGRGESFAGVVAGEVAGDMSPPTTSTPPLLPVATVPSLACCLRAHSTTSSCVGVANSSRMMASTSTSSPRPRERRRSRNFITSSCTPSWATSSTWKHKHTYMHGEGTNNGGMVG